MIRLSVIIPTCGRSTLTATLDSLRLQFTPADEVIVIGDGPQPNAALTFARSGLRGWYLQTGHATHNWGNTQRNYGMERAGGSHLLFIDDDDCFLPGALPLFREALAKEPGRIPIFRFRYPDGRLVWQVREMVCGNVGTGIFAVPNDRTKLPRWRERYEADFDFLESCSRVWAVDWRDEVVCQVRPHETPP